MLLGSPYTSIVDADLAHFSALEALQFNIVLQHFLNLHPNTFTHGRWNRLSEVLTQPGACPRLREVAIRMHLRASGVSLAGVVGRTGEECKEDAGRIAGALSESVYPAQFFELIQQRPQVELSFVTEVSVGSDLWDHTERLGVRA